MLAEILRLDLEDLKLSKSDEEERERQKKRREYPPFIRSLLGESATTPTTPFCHSDRV